MSIQSYALKRPFLFLSPKAQKEQTTRQSFMCLRPILWTKLQAKEHCLQLQIWSIHVFPWSGSFNAIFIFTMDAIELCKRTPARRTCQGSVVDLQFQRELLWQTVFCYFWRLLDKSQKNTHNIVLNKNCFQIHCQLYHSNKMISDSDVPPFFFCATFWQRKSLGFFF